MSDSFGNLDADAMRLLENDLSANGVRAIMGTAVNAAGVTLAKSVPLARLSKFHSVGLGAAPVWHVFCIDAAIAFAGGITAVGDMRLRLDADAVRDLGDGLAWGPTQYFDQDGTPHPGCTRTLLRSVERRLDDAGLAARVGHELEFVLVDSSGPGEGAWVPYGATGLLDRERFVADLYAAADSAGLEVEQVHAEYGRNQIELSFAPTTPVAAADSVVLAKVLVGRVARRHDLRVSFSPVPYAGSVGNGAHQHISLTRDGAPLFGVDGGTADITVAGRAAIGGVLAGLPDVQGVLTGSVLSGGRLAPGLWSGVHNCWGLENREAALRFVRGGASNPYGANIEVKVVDSSANVYVASAALLLLALNGIDAAAPLPDPVSGDPSAWSQQQLHDAGISLLPSDLGVIVDRLDGSALARKLLGDSIVDAAVATRRHELDTYGDAPAEEAAERFRFAWSI